MCNYYLSHAEWTKERSQVRFEEGILAERRLRQNREVRQGIQGCSSGDKINGHWK